jgi:hypothetical protein
MTFTKEELEMILGIVDQLNDLDYPGRTKTERDHLNSAIVQLLLIDPNNFN